MTGAMYAAVSGLRAHMSKLNVIGNNIANVNTAGYKASRMIFTESIYTTLKSGSNGTAVNGGTNPSQVGYGCQVGTIDLDMSSKNYNPTGVGLDCMIDGEGFFMVGDKTGGITSDNVDALELTRLGRFDIHDGYLVDGEGKVVYGFLCYAEEDAPGVAAGVSTELAPIRLPLAAKGPADGDPVDDDTLKAGSALYPTLGGDNDSITVDATGAQVATDSEGNPSRVQLTGIAISADGSIVGTNATTGKPVVIGYVALARVDNPAGLTHTDGPYYQALDGAGKVHVCSIGNAVTGNLNNKGDDDATSDDLIGGTGKTTILSGGLESSGTDLANEITEMITTQRGYQANTRIITVTDSMLEELVNMKR